MASDPWGDYENFVTAVVPRQTVAKLRSFADVFSKHSGIHIAWRSQDRKGDVVEKVRNAFHTLKRGNRVQEYLTIRRECESIINLGRLATPVLPPPTFGGVPASNNFAGPSRLPTVGSYAANAAGAGAGWQRYGQDPFRQYGTQNRGASGNQPVLQDWKASPLWKPVRALTNIESLPDIQSQESNHTRRERRTHFQLPNDVIDLLNKSKNDPRSRPIHSIRLFCTSSEHYRPPGMTPIPGNPPVTNRQIPIEYPLNPDVHVDDHTVPFKERGLRGKAGSAPPLDLDTSRRGLVRIPGRMANMVFGHTGPTVSKRKEITKKFYFQIVYCEMTPIDDLLKKLEALAPTDAAAERAKLRNEQDDDDIQIGLSHLSLKDPLAGMRITKPIRSSKCNHLQCFDARWWLEANRTHPQWLCPHCSKELKFEELICDGYFLSILNAVNDDYEEVVLEANGDWHTADNKHGNAEWVASTAVSRAPSVTVKRQRSESLAVDRSPTITKRAAIEILSDSDDDDEPLASKSQSVADSNGRAKSTSTMAEPTVIDLTISDSESDDEPSQPLRFQKPPVSQTPSADIIDAAAAAAAAAVSVTSPPHADPSNPTAFSDALRSILDTGRPNGHAPPINAGATIPGRQLHPIPNRNTQYHAAAASLPPIAQPSRTTYPGTSNGHTR